MDNQEGSFRSLIGQKFRLLLNNLYNSFSGRDIEAYIVGGFIRDSLLGRDTADIDIVVSSDALEVASEVADILGGKYIPLDVENRIGRVVIKDREEPSTKNQLVLDFTTLKGDIEQDLACRDFTIDAMAVHLKDTYNGTIDDKSETITNSKTDDIIDPFGGRDDLQRGMIRVINGTAFSSDAVRLLRAVRLAAELEFSIDKETEALIREYSDLITGVAGERVREELLRLLAVHNAGEYIVCLDELGLLVYLFPELEAAKGVEQPREHFWDVYKHSLKTVSAVDYLLGQGTWEYADEKVLASVPWSSELAEHLKKEVSNGSTRKSMLRLAALLHDICKPRTKALDNGRVRFLRHGSEGAVVAAGILEKLRFSSKEIKLVATEIEYHLRPTQMSQEGLPTRRAIYRYFRDTGEAGFDILFLSLADHLATRGPNLDLVGWQEHTRLVDYVIGKYFEQKNVVQSPKTVDGYDIINIFGVSPGPGVGEVLEAVREAQAAGEVSTREEAMTFIKKFLASSRSPKGEQQKD
ncbi:CCA tRNA nucleotidyltransferase [Chloroflexota bacterium]